MRRVLGVGVMAVMFAAARVAGAPVERPAPMITMDADRFEVTGEGSSLTALRRAPVAFSSVSDLSDAVAKPTAMAAAARLVRAVPPQVIDYVFCVTEDGTLVVGQQVRTLDGSGRYIFTGGAIKRAYSAREATVPWVWNVDIPLGREMTLTLELRAAGQQWPVRSVSVTPSVSK